MPVFARALDCQASLAVHTCAFWQHRIERRRASLVIPAECLPLALP